MRLKSVLAVTLLFVGVIGESDGSEELSDNGSSSVESVEQLSFVDGDLDASEDNSASQSQNENPTIINISLSSDVDIRSVLKSLSDAVQSDLTTSIVSTWSVPTAQIDIESTSLMQLQQKEDQEPIELISQQPINYTQNLTHADSLNVTIINQTEPNEDIAHFLSFEEWKKQKVGKDADAFKIAKINTNPRVRNDHSHMNQLGEEMEIDANLFTSNNRAGSEEGKTYKDKFNYASFDCAATIVKTNNEAKGAGSILVENKDSYLLNECAAANKFVIIELCQDILIDSIVVGNFEFFSSMFRHIRVSVSDRFPVPATGWKVLGEYEAENVRDIQTFSIKNPLIWARYLRLEVLSHYGNEFYCPLSLVRVHGKTMMEEFKLEEEERVRQDQEEGDIQEHEPPEVNIGLEESETTTIKTNSINFIMTDDMLSDECSVILPHLGLEKFLEEIDADSYCKVAPQVPSSAEPTTQESIYKNIMNRLGLLESNASLSLLYIEEQSKLLSDAFTRLERRQSGKFDSLVDAFNSTLRDQLTHLAQFYGVFQSETDALMRNQSNQFEQLKIDAKSEMVSLTEELQFQRRLTILNSIIIVCLLVYVVVTRDTSIITDGTDETEWYVSPSGSPTPSRGPSKKIAVGRRSKQTRQIYFYGDATFTPHDRSPSDGSVVSSISATHTTEFISSQTPNISPIENPNANIGFLATTQVASESSEENNNPPTPENSD